MSNNNDDDDTTTTREIEPATNASFATGPTNTRTQQTIKPAALDDEHQTINGKTARTTKTAKDPTTPANPEDYKKHCQPEIAARGEPPTR